MTAPLITVVMPTFQQARWLPAAIESVLASPVEHKLVIVDDASADEGATWKIATEYARRFPEFGTRLQNHVCALRRLENGGPAEAINVGIRSAARREDAYWSWVSSDNVMSPDWLSTLVAAIEANKAGAVYGGFDWQAPGSKPSYQFTAHEPSKLIDGEACYYGPAFLLRADVWREAGEHRGAISHDYDHWLRVEEVCARRGMPIVGVDRSLCHYNAHDERVTVRRADTYDAPKWRAEARRRRGLA